MPITKCSICGGEWAHPSGWFAHIENCSPARKQQVVTAARGLMLALQLTEEKPR